MVTVDKYIIWGMNKAECEFSCWYSHSALLSLQMNFQSLLGG